MKICVINNLYKPFNRGGADRITELIVDGLKAKGYDVFVIATKPYNSRLKILDLRYKDYYISGFFYDLGKIPLPLRLVWHVVDMFDVGMFLRIRAILKKEKPDVVITNNLKGLSYLVPKSIKSLGIKHIHILHDIQLIHPSGLLNYGEEERIESLFAKIYIILCRWLFDSPTTVISPSKWLLGLHVKRGFFPMSKKSVIPNPIEISRSEILHDNLRTKESKIENFQFLFVGQIEVHKGIFILVDSFVRFMKENSGNANLTIIGSGSQDDMLSEEIKNIGNIEFLGAMDNNEVKSWMAAANCLIVPSLCYENSPTVIYEAASIGLPVIASDIGGIPELIEMFGGFLVKPKDSSALVEKMKLAMDLINNNTKEIEDKSKEALISLATTNYIKRLEELF